MRHVVGFKEMPSERSGFLLDGLPSHNEAYTKEERRHGTSGWTLYENKLLVDSIASSSYVRIRVMAQFGFLVGGRRLLCVGRLTTSLAVCQFPQRHRVRL